MRATAGHRRVSATPAGILDPQPPDSAPGCLEFVGEELVVVTTNQVYTFAVEPRWSPGGTAMPKTIPAGVLIAGRDSPSGTCPPAEPA